MPTYNQPIRTKQGENLANRVRKGLTKITYTRIVYSSMDLSDFSDDQLAQLTEIEPQELSTPATIVNDPSDDPDNPEVDIKAVANNKSLTKGLTVNTYALYAMGDDHKEILFGVALDNHPSYLPAYQNSDTSQTLTYEWVSSIQNTDNINMTDPNDVYVTYDAFDRHRSNANSLINYDNSSLASSESVATSTLSMSANEGITGNGDRIEAVFSQATSYATSTGDSALASANAQEQDDIANLQGSLNNLPTWDDGNETRNQIAPSLADSAKNEAENQASQDATNALNQANNYTDNQSNNLQNQINNNNNNHNGTENNLQQQITSNKNNILFKQPQALPDNDLNNDTTTGVYYIFGLDLKNCPTSNNSNNKGVFGSLVVVAMGNMVFQKLTKNSSFTFVRRLAGSPASWDAWQETTTKSFIDDLQNQINSRPTWDDENWTRTQANQAATNAMNQANSHTDGRINDLLEIQPLPNNDCFAVNKSGRYRCSTQSDYSKHMPNDIKQNVNPLLISTYEDAWNIYFILNDGQNIFICFNKGKWVKITNQNDFDDLQSQINNSPGHQVSIPSPQDINNFTSPGWYFIGNGKWPNAPTNNNFYLNVVNGAYNNIIQIAYSVWNNGVWERTVDAGDWKGWTDVTKQVKTASNEGDAQNQSNQHPGTLFVYPG